MREPSNPPKRLPPTRSKSERQIADLVNEAYALTPDEVALPWQTAPPRMPFERNA